VPITLHIFALFPCIFYDCGELKHRGF